MNHRANNGDTGESNEVERRERALTRRGEIQEGSGRVVEPRGLGQMVSVRLDADLVGSLREIAQSRDTTLSGVLRDAARQYVSTQASVSILHWRVTHNPATNPTFGYVRMPAGNPSLGVVHEVPT